jgi:hypothetical protein
MKDKERLEATKRFFRGLLFAILLVYAYDFTDWEFWAFMIANVIFD